MIHLVCYCCCIVALLRRKQCLLPWKMPCGAGRDLGLYDPSVNEVTESLLKWLHQSKTGLQKSVTSFSKITITVCTPPFNKTHLKVLTIACCATAYLPWATVYSDTIIGTFQHHCKAGGVSRPLFPTRAVAPLGGTISWPPREPNSRQQSGRKQEKIHYPVERVCSRACPMHGENCILAVWIILSIISKRLKLNDLFSLASCHCCSEIQCYKTSRHSRRAGAEKQLVSLWQEAH